MASRISARSDPVIPSSDHSTGLASGDPPATTAQPANKAGRGVALRSLLPLDSAPLPTRSANFVGLSSSPPSSGGSMKRPRPSSPPRPVAEAGNDTTAATAMEEEFHSPSASISDDQAAQSWAAMTEDEELKEEVEEVEEEMSHPPPRASLPTPPAAVPHERDYVPSYVGKPKLLSVGVDPAMDTALLVTLKVDEAMPSPPQVDRSRFALSSEGRRKLVAILLGSNTGFGIKLPDIPRVLVTGTTTSTAFEACNSLTGPRREWWTSLQQMAQQHGAMMKELKPAVNDAARSKINCGRIWRKSLRGGAVPHRTNFGPARS